jgi:hypothetical protein
MPDVGTDADSSRIEGSIRGVKADSSMDNDTAGAGLANYDRTLRAIYLRALGQAGLGYGIGRYYGVCCLVCLRLPGNTRHEVLELRTGDRTRAGRARKGNF